jgi:hypothetical protein
MVPGIAKQYVAAGDPGKDFLLEKSSSRDINRGMGDGPDQPGSPL